MVKRQHNQWFIALVVFALLEFGLVSYLQNCIGIYLSPILFFFASLGVSGSAMYAAYNTKSLKSTITNNPNLLFYMLIPFVLVVVCFGYAAFSSQPIDNAQSDVFAQVLSPSKWLLEGEYPYQEIVLPSYTMHNTYLPMQWLPFILSIGFNFDPRWIPIGLWAAALVFFAKNFKTTRDRYTSTSLWFTMLCCALSVIGILGFIDKNKNDYVLTLELLPTAYYILLVLFLVRGSWLGIGLTMGACLMSRFTIVLFIPFLIYYLYCRFGWSTVWKSCVVTGSFIAIVFILPFMIKDAQLPNKIFENYQNGAVGEWKTHSWQKPGSEPFQLARGIGAAIFFKKMFEDDLNKGVTILKKLGLGVSFLTGIQLMFFYYQQKQSIDDDWFLLGALKLFLTVFYTFVIIPYPYLFLLPITITSLIFIKYYHQYDLERMIAKGIE